MLESYLKIINKDLVDYKLTVSNKKLDGIDNVLFMFKGRLLKSYAVDNDKGIIGFLDGFYSATQLN